jgi:hypothetical protein
MKVLSAICAFLLFAAVVATAKPKEWSEQEAIAEAHHDFRTHHIKFYWHGTIASMPVGIPAQYTDLVRRYPHADGGIGCIVRDHEFRERQGQYSETYNKLMLSLLLKSQ